jgi:phospholipid transport system substrate-binding protein
MTWPWSFLSLHVGAASGRNSEIPKSHPAAQEGKYLIRLSAAPVRSIRPVWKSLKLSFRHNAYSKINSREGAKMGKISVFCLIGVLCIASLAHGSQPMEALQGPMGEILAILKDPQFEDVSLKQVQRDKVFAIIREVFDFEELAKRTLAANWRRFTEKERAEFTDIFAEFLGNTYLDRIQKNYRDQEIIYLGQDLQTETKARIQTKIIADTGEIPVTYSMIRRDAGWRVYDIVIEGVSLVKNYRTQFRSILLKETPQELIERLKRKIDA